jgi:hypothetical protein
MKKINIFQTPNEFFYETILNHLKESNVNLDKEVEFYLVEMLSRFIKTDELYASSSSGFINSPICLLLKEAEEETKDYSKILLFRQAGDLALYKVSIFSSKKESNEYYKTLGMLAYNRVADLQKRDQLKNLYRNLSSNFNKISNLLKTAPNININKK